MKNLEKLDDILDLKEFVSNMITLCELLGKKRLVCKLEDVDYALMKEAHYMAQSEEARRISKNFANAKEDK